MIHKENRESNEVNKEHSDKNKATKKLFADPEEMEKGIERIMGIGDRD